MTAVLGGFAGPGGFDEAARMVGLPTGVGVEWNADACATATAASHPRIQADVRTLDPDDFPAVQGAMFGPPCPTYSASGKRTGRSDYDLVLAGSTLLGDGLFTDSPTYNACTATYRQVQDERSALVLEALRFALRLPDLEWLVFEQVPAVARIWWDFAAELAIAAWESCDVVTLRADDFGLPTRRPRVFLVAARTYTPDFTGMPVRARWRTGRFTEPDTVAPHMLTPFPLVSMADALGWPSGVQVNTRGERTTPGGNLFSADAPAPGLTYTARSWYRTDLGKPDGELDSWQAGLLQGFPADYPWQGSRTSRFQRVADSVPPPMAAAVVGAAAGVPWQDAVWARLSELYGVERRDSVRLCDTGRARPNQTDLFEVAA
jgi:DNA (cytosine-5)-methyltransferase 1